MLHVCDHLEIESLVLTWLYIVLVACELIIFLLETKVIHSWIINFSLDDFICHSKEKRFLSPSHRQTIYIVLISSGMEWSSFAEVNLGNPQQFNSVLLSTS